MSRKIQILGMACLAMLTVLMTLVLAGKPVANVQLRASFEPLMAPEVPYAIQNDAKGPYVTDGKHNVSVWFTGDNGELFFKFEHHSSRSMIIHFPYAYSECGGWLPDTAGDYPNLPDEPIDFFRFTTFNSDAFAPPKVNFLTMPADTPTPVRLWTTFCTTQRHYYFMNYSLTQNRISGVVGVTASRLTPNGPNVRWVITPVFGSGGMAEIYKHPETGDDSINCPFGAWPMPFKLVLERLQ